MNRSFDRGRKLARVLLIFSMLAVLTLIILGVASLF
jgi:hypothetical protein